MLDDDAADACPECGAYPDQHHWPTCSESGLDDEDDDDFGDDDDDWGDDDEEAYAADDDDDDLDDE